MGGKGAATSSSPSKSSTVCCMCGDHGLPQELFRCKVCRFRSQHKYCSDLYPKVESYRACNWCLREEGCKSISSSSSTNYGGLGAKLHRGTSFSSHLNKPIKKQRLPAERSLSDVNERMRARQGFRGKVRRYKLLEDVSS